MTDLNWEVKLNNKFHIALEFCPIIGMVHLGGEQPLEQAMQDIRVYQEEGLDAALVENYCAPDPKLVSAVLRRAKLEGIKMPLGVNILPKGPAVKSYDVSIATSFSIARAYSLPFLQLDMIAGNYTSGSLNTRVYASWKRLASEVVVIGGVHPKYWQPIDTNTLRQDLETGMARAEVIACTGAGTGIETPLDRLIEFRNILGDHPLCVAAGTTPDNIVDQLEIADAVIVGSTFKPGKREDLPAERTLVREYLDAAGQPPSPWLT